jgi:hypothetical protein
LKLNSKKSSTEQTKARKSQSHGRQTSRIHPPV